MRIHQNAELFRLVVANAGVGRREGPAWESNFDVTGRLLDGVSLANFRTASKRAGLRAPRVVDVEEASLRRAPVGRRRII